MQLIISKMETLLLFFMVGFVRMDSSVQREGRSVPCILLSAGGQRHAGQGSAGGREAPRRPWLAVAGSLLAPWPGRQWQRWRSSW